MSKTTDSILFNVRQTLTDSINPKVLASSGRFFKAGDVFDYVVSKKSVMPRTALRYAIEKMPANFRAEAMKK